MQPTPKAAQKLALIGSVALAAADADVGQFI
jgi:hypothetical protein